MFSHFLILFLQIVAYFSASLYLCNSALSMAHTSASSMCYYCTKRMCVGLTFQLCSFLPALETGAWFSPQPVTGPDSKSVTHSPNTAHLHQWLVLKTQNRTLCSSINFHVRFEVSHLVVCSGRVFWVNEALNDLQTWHGDCCSDCGTGVLLRLTKQLHH